MMVQNCCVKHCHNKAVSGTSVSFHKKCSGEFHRTFCSFMERQMLYKTYEELKSCALPTFEVCGLFPWRNKQRLAEWISCVSRVGKDGKSWYPTKNDRVCSAHFTSSDYYSYEGIVRRELKDSAVPSIFPCHPPTTQPKVTQKQPPKRCTVTDSTLSGSSSKVSQLPQDHLHSNRYIEHRLEKTDDNLNKLKDNEREESLQLENPKRKLVRRDKEIGVLMSEEELDILHVNFEPDTLSLIENKTSAMEVDDQESSKNMPKSLVNGEADASSKDLAPSKESSVDGSGSDPADEPNLDLKKSETVVENGVCDDDSKGKDDFQTKEDVDNSVQKNMNGASVESIDSDSGSEQGSKSAMDVEPASSDSADSVGTSKNDNNKQTCMGNDSEHARKENDDKIDEKNDSEKENAHSGDAVGHKESNEKGTGSSTSQLDKNIDSNDDIEIIGESKVIQISSPTVPNSSSQNVVLVPQMGGKNAMFPALNHKFSPSGSVFGSHVNSSPYSPGMPNMHPGFMMGGAAPNHSPSLSLLPHSVSPPKPKSSLDQIELIRWEIQNRINTRPKYFKPNPSAELGPLAKFLFDIGSDLIKESVYHELVKIQSKKQDDDKLSPKEKEDLEKLKDIERDLNHTVGHLKLRMKKRCRACHFQTESANVMYNHKQFPHEDSKNLLCAHCNFVTKQPMNYKFHMESEHCIQPRLHEKKFFYECELCPYENNQEQKLTIHKQRCAKQFRPLFNLHPSCLSGAEINLCLENIFYKPIVPKNLKILQQKHLQQQAALAEARRQQAEVAALAAQKNAQSMVKRQRQPPPVSHIHTPPINNRPHIHPRLPAPPMSQVRFNSRTPVQTIRPTVANMLKDKQTTKVGAGFPHHGGAPVGFEVCEICGGYVKDRKALRIHFFYAHRIDLPLNLFDRNQPPLYCATCCVRFWTANGLRKHLDVHVQEKRIPEGFIGEGVSGKCIACGQVVGNIVVHMRVVHNREIHHYINALMCMFCGASFNTHANVERHVKDVHGTIDIATGAVKVKGKLKSSPPMPKLIPPPKKPAPNNNSLVKGSVCVLCNLNFGRNVDLTRHCMRMHHTCMKCGMVVIDKASLLKHTCLSSPSGTRDCTMCSETGFHPAYYVKHLRDKHLKKFSIDVARLSVPVIERWIKRSYPFRQVQEELVEISDSDEDAPIAMFKVETPSKSPRKKPRIGPASKINRPLLSNGVGNADSCDSITIVDDRKEEENICPKGAFSDESPIGSKRKQSLDSSLSPDFSAKRRK